MRNIPADLNKPAEAILRDNTALGKGLNAAERRCQSRPIKKRAAGVTLVELLITIAVLGILTSLAIPSYQNFIQNDRRVDAHHLLLANSSQLTKCLTLAGSYDGGCRLLTDSKEGYYFLATTLTPQTWTITALPNPAKSQVLDTDCESFSLTHIGIQSATGDSPTSCW